MDFRIKPNPTRTGEPMVEVWDADRMIAGIYIGDFPLSLLVESTHFSHAVFDCHQQPEKLIAHFKDEANDPAQ